MKVIYRFTQKHKYNFILSIQIALFCHSVIAELSHFTVISTALFVSMSYYGKGIYKGHKKASDIMSTMVSEFASRERKMISTVVSLQSDNALLKEKLAKYENNL